MEPSRPYRKWLFVAGSFLAGQGFIAAANYGVGIAFVRLLSIEEYSLYVLAAVLLTISSTGSDMGLSQALNTLGARVSQRPERVSVLLHAAIRYRRVLFIGTAVIITTIAGVSMGGRKWPVSSVAGSLSIVLVTGWVQTTISLRKTVLNIYHDSSALFRAGMTEALTRLAMIGLVVLRPTALIALTANLMGACTSGLILSTHCVRFVVREPRTIKEQSELRSFIIPLIPAVTYFVIQGQLGPILLGFYGYTKSIAEVGALSRLGQFIALLMMLNPFLIQPSLARITDKRTFTSCIRLILTGLMILTIASVMSAYWSPGSWLSILGHQYSTLRKELPIAILGSMMGLAGATIYTMVISQRVTSGQFWSVVTGMGGQTAFLLLHGVHTTADALILSILPQLTYTMTQLCLLAYVIQNWDHRHQLEREKALHDAADAVRVGAYT